ncbi:hypothetical protein [uncultured Clostridium sp.]|jgi:hypothetical protein|uniref:hypothetical protein n=1 Tax=uncultured Clostridium sp. TaxID=59620 RepID=UPI002619A9E4|nr:hypothetical protein [uncultured Clostridium sp.]
MNILALILELYLIVTGIALLTTVARFLATSKEEKELKKKMLKKMLEQTMKQNADVINNNNSIISKFMRLKISGIQEDNRVKVFIFNFIMHFVPIFNVGVLLSNLNDIVITFKN